MNGLLVRISSDIDGMIVVHFEVGMANNHVSSITYILYIRRESRKMPSSRSEP